MEISVTINGKRALLSGNPDERLRDVLYRSGYSSVRDSDDGEGFAGSDTIILNNKLVYSNLIMLYQVEDAEIRTPEGLLDGRKINDVQEAMVKLLLKTWWPLFWVASSTYKKPIQTLTIKSGYR